METTTILDVVNAITDALAGPVLPSESPTGANSSSHNCTSCNVTDVLHHADHEDGHDFIPWDNPDNVISQGTLHIIEQIFTCGINVVLLAVGVPVNIITCLVFFRQGLKDRMNLCLFSLAVVDMLNIVFCFFTGSSNLLENLSPEIRFWWKWTIRKYCRGLHAAFMFGSGALTMVVAVERCVCVTWPMKAANLMSTKTMAIIVAAVVVVLNVLSLVYLTHYTVEEFVDVVTKEVGYRLVPTVFYTENKAFLDFIHSMIISIAVPFTSFVVVSVATLLTVINLKRAIMFRESSTGNTSVIRSQINLAKMLTIICVIYIITAIPHIALGITRLTVPDFSFHGRYANIFVAAHVMPLSLTAFNSTVNFFVYFTRSSRFRRELDSMMPRCCQRQTDAQNGLKPDANQARGGETKVSTISEAQ